MPSDLVNLEKLEQVATQNTRPVWFRKSNRIECTLLVMEQIGAPTSRKGRGIRAEEDPSRPKNLKGFTEDSLERQVLRLRSHPGVRARGVDQNIGALRARQKSLSKEAAAEVWENEMDVPMLFSGPDHGDWIRETQVVGGSDSEEIP